MVSARETSVITRVLKDYNKTEEEIETFYGGLHHLKDFDKISPKSNNFTDIIAILKRHYFTIETVMEEVHQKCENLLLFCTFNGKIKNFGYKNPLPSRPPSRPTGGSVKTDMSQRPYSKILHDKDNLKYTNPQWTRDEDIEYYDDPSADDVKSNGGIIMTSQSGRGSGLSIVFNVEPDDYPSWSTVPYYGAKILLTDPNDYPETTVLYKYISIGESLDIKVEPKVFQCEDDVRGVEPLRRECWFHDEVSLEHTDRYSYETCKTECRMQNYLTYCGCIPYKYPRETSIRICEFEDLPCLSNYRVYRIEGQRPCEPVCLSECRDKKYSITSDNMPFLRESVPANVTVGRNVSELAALQVYFAKSTSNCYKLTLLMDFNYFIATYGGIFSLSFGASMLTLFEIAYLLIAALVNIMRRTVRRT
ncbi:sodium channel protein Nach-like [Epargyreus clarus]|uniref:sodium channel protein Nach-like n=1 Tax=Epargyreus clarus TaxID=520877 RepID=UPI003C2F818F